MRYGSIVLHLTQYASVKTQREIKGEYPQRKCQMTAGSSFKTVANGAALGGAPTGGSEATYGELQRPHLGCKKALRRFKNNSETKTRRPTVQVYMEQAYLYLIVTGYLAWFFLHFIWTFRFSKWLFAWRYDSPFDVFLSRTLWGAGWVVLLILFLASLGRG